MSNYELPKAYDFKDTEPRVYAMWEALYQEVVSSAR